MKTGLIDRSGSRQLTKLTNITTTAEIVQTVVDSNPRINYRYALSTDPL